MAGRTRSKKNILTHITAAGLAVLLLLSVCAPVYAGLLPKNNAKSGEKKAWTVMVYMIGSNLESRMGSASEDIFEMEDAGIDYLNNNLVLYTGGSMRWMTDIPSDRNCILDMSLDEDERIVASTEESEDMGEPDTLASFVNYCHENYPAERNMLIFWDHGNGPISGYGNDELFDGDSLLLGELDEAMKMTPYAGDEKLDLIGFDACLMGSLECMTIMSAYADYYIGSEELEPGDGWDYSALSVLNGKKTGPMELAEEIIDGYGAYYDKKTGDKPGITLSLADLSKVQEVNVCLDELAFSVSGNMGLSEYATLQRNRRNSRSFGFAGSAEKAVEDTNFDIVDLKDLAKNLSEDYPEEAEALIRSVDEMICRQFANIEGAGGVTVYFPSGNKGQYRNSFKSYKKISSAVKYNELLERFGSSWQDEKTRDWVLEQPKMQGEEILLQLTGEQLEYMTGATYSVLLSNGDDYIVLKALCRIEPDEKGVLHVPADPFVPVYGDETTGLLGTQIVQLNNGYDDEYVPLNLGLTGDLFDYQYRSNYWDEIEWVSARISQDQDTGEIEVLSVSPNPDFEPAAGKTDTDLSKYEALVTMNLHYTQTNDENGRPLPFQEWESSTDRTTIGFLGIERELSFSSIRASELAGAGIQIQITDVSGERYASDLIPVKAGKEYRTVEEKTDQGSLVYDVYRDHAELTGYHGDDTALTLPEMVDGVPLTVIGDGVFGYRGFYSGKTVYPIEELILPDTVEEIGKDALYNLQGLRSLSLPASLKTIGETAFAYCSGLTELVIPEGVTDIGKGAFAYCENMVKLTLPSSLQELGTGAMIKCASLKEIAVNKNSRFSVSDGVLYSEYDKTLLACPGGRSKKTVAVRDGTKHIAYGAFFGVEGLRVSFPDSLEEIGNSAFGDCTGLTVENWPKSLQRVGEYAFGVTDYFYTTKEASLLPVRIEIGPDVSYIGKGAFDLFRIKNFSVDRKNRYFEVKNGTLMNKSCDVVMQFATQEEAYAEYPEGTVSMKWEDFGFLLCYYSFFRAPVFHVKIPASVIRFPKTAWTENIKLLIHCLPGSPAEKYAVEQGIPFTNEMEVEYTLIKEETGSGTAWYHLFKDHAELVGLSCMGETYEIPAEVKGVPVTAAGDGVQSLISFAYENGDEEAGFAKQITVPDTVREIRDHAFEYTSSRNLLILPDTIVRFGSAALGSASLKDSFFTINDKIVYIGPDAMRSISEYRTEGENEYYSVREGILYSKDGSRLISYPGGREGDQDVIIPDGTKIIGEKSFMQNNSLTGVTIPDSVKVIEDLAFQYCFRLRSVKGGKNIKEIGVRAFDGCSRLEGFTFYEGLGSIGDFAFASVPFEGELRFPDSLKTIGEYAFRQEASSDEEKEDNPEVSIYIGKNVSEIGDSAFQGRNIKEYVVDPENMFLDA